jgi:hypothetical protein
MGRIARVGFTETFKALDVHGKVFHEERGDCGVKAISIVCQVHYDTVLAELTKRGRKKGRATPNALIIPMLEHFGKKVIERQPYDFIHQYPSPHRDLLQHVTSHHPRRFPQVWRDGRTYLFRTNGHILGAGPSWR